jgi:DNA-binding IclR family transcriptional regulator
MQSASEIGRRARLPSSTAHRIVDDLVHLGLLDRDEDGRVQLGIRLWELAQRGSKTLQLRQVALPHMARAQGAIRQHTQLAVLGQDSALFIERLSHPDATSNITRVAGRLPINASSAGLVLLAFAPAPVQDRILKETLPALTTETITDATVLRAVLSHTRKVGYVEAPGSVELVATGVAVPVRDPAGEVIAAISMVLPRDQPTGGAIRELMRAAAGIRVDLRRDDSALLSRAQSPGDGRSAGDEHENRDEDGDE